MENEIIIFPLAERGHLDVMVELAKLLHRSSVSTTILIAQIFSVHHSNIDTYISRVSTAHPYLSFHHLPPINPPSTLLDHLKTYLYTSSARAIILDFSLSSSIEIAAEFHLPFYFFFPSSVFILSAAFLALKEVDVGGNTSMQLQLPPTLCPIPVPDIIRITGQTNETDAMIVQYKRLSQSSGIILNSFNILERVALDSIAERNLVPVYCVGPITGKDSQEIYSSEELQHESLTWLSDRPRNSVVFLCFERRGSVLPGEQMREIAVGLERSGQSFLWVVRVPQELDAALPKGFLERTKTRGLVVKSWVPQVAVLEHPAVGGFVTHCGWNSVMESIVAGVPMIAWPQQKEHMVNKNFLVEVARIAVAMRGGLTDGVVHSDEIVERVRWLMNTEGGEEMRERVAAAGVGGMEALKKGGSSFAAIAEVAREVKLLDLN